MTRCSVCHHPIRWASIRSPRAGDYANRATGHPGWQHRTLSDLESDVGEHHDATPFTIGIGAADAA
jgi:hypothetical protein